MTTPRYKCVGCGQFGHDNTACTAVHRPTKGQDNGGIRTLDDLKGRCFVDDNGCWQWRGAFNTASRGVATPVTWFAAEGKTMSAMRVAWLLARPGAPRVQMVWRTCLCQSCLNPAHLRGGSRKQWGAWQHNKGHLRTFGRTLANTVARHARNKKNGEGLTQELAQWARESSQTGLEVAHALNVSRTAVSRARRMKTFSMFGAASVFTAFTTSANDRSAEAVA